MPWFYVDDGFSDSKPIMNLPTTPVRVPMRIAAAGAWVLGGSWSAKEELDGFIPHSKLKSLLVPKSVVAALVDPGPMDAALCCPKNDGILVKNWAKWQQTKAEIEAKRKREAEKKRNQRRRGRNFVTGIDDEMSPGDIDGDRDTGSKFVSPGDSPGPTPPHPLVVTRESVYPVGSGSPATHTESAPPKFCDAHPQGTRQRCGDCANARIVFQAWESDRVEREASAQKSAAASRAQSKALIDECPECDPGGWLLGPDGDPVEPAIRCDHLTTRRARNG